MQKIGKLTLKTISLEGALTRASMLGANDDRRYARPAVDASGRSRSPAGAASTTNLGCRKLIWSLYAGDDLHVE